MRLFQRPRQARASKKQLMHATPKHRQQNWPTTKRTRQKRKGRRKQKTINGVRFIVKRLIKSFADFYFGRKSLFLI